MQFAELKQYEKSDYPYSITARRESITKNKDALKAIRENSFGLSLKEALNSDELQNFIPDLFLDEIIQLGLRTAIARNNFPVVAQSSHGSFKQRFRWKDEGVAVTSKELVEVTHTQSERDVVEFSFLKLMDSNVLSLELIEDSTLDEATAEVSLSANKFFRRENQLFAHRLAEYSQGATATKWDNYKQGPDSSSTDAEIIDAMTDAYLDITTRLTDQFPTESLTWFVSPEVYSRLFKNDSFRRFDIMGRDPNITTGRVNVDDRIFRIPIQIWEPGIFSTDSEWISQPYDIYLVATQFAAAIRERSSMRTTPLDMTKILASAIMLWERLIPWVRNPFAYRRISPSQSFSDIIGNMSNIHIISGKDDTTVFPDD